MTGSGARELFWGLSTCPGCGSFRIDESLLCGPCRGALGALQRPQVRSAGPFQIRSLYDWNPGESDLLSRYVHALKGRWRERAWAECAWDFVTAHGLENDPRSFWFVPAPSRTQARDHAGHWAAALADVLQAPCLEDLLRRGEGVSQKALKRADRWDRHLVKLSREVPTMMGQAVFADDVLTTGATADAVHRLLGRERELEVWVLAHRTTFLAERLPLW